MREQKEKGKGKTFGNFSFLKIDDEDLLVYPNLLQIQNNKGEQNLGLWFI